MRFFTALVDQTRNERESLTSVPVIAACLAGQVTLPSYLAFLTQAWHHVRHTVPLMQACRAALPSRLAWVVPDLDEYIAEEVGHDEWILNDLAACGIPPDQSRATSPAFDTEVMVAYAYDTIARRNPMGFFGMVHVLEGTSVALALKAADRIEEALGLPPVAFSYLRSHGTLDREHTAHFESLMNRVTDPADRVAVVHAARMFYRLYGNIFRSLPMPVLAARTGHANTELSAW